MTSTLAGWPGGERSADPGRVSDKKLQDGFDLNPDAYGSRDVIHALNTTAFQLFANLLEMRIGLATRFAPDHEKLQQTGVTPEVACAQRNTCVGRERVAWA